MIRINLLGEKVDRSGTYFVHTASFVGSLLVAMVACFVFHETMASELESLTNEKSILDSQLLKLTEKTKKVENLEASKKLLQEKLTTIAKLKTKKSAPVHLLSDITLAIPERSWMVGIRQKTEGLEFKGVALDPQTVSQFMTKLESSKWISEVALVESKQTVKQDVPVQEFTLLVKLTNPLEKKNTPPAGTKKESGKGAEKAAPASSPVGEAVGAEKS